MLETSDAWSMSCSSHRPSEPAYYIEDCRILTQGYKIRLFPRSRSCVMIKTGHLLRKLFNQNFSTLQSAQIYTLLGPRAVMNIAQAFKIKLRNFFQLFKLTTDPKNGPRKLTEKQEAAKVSMNYKLMTFWSAQCSGQKWNPKIKYID